MRVQVEEPRITATTLLWSGSIGAVTAFNQLIMILFLTYFILLSDKMFRRKFVELAGPTLTKKKITVEIIDDISSQIGRFLIVQIFTSIVVGVDDVGGARGAWPRVGGVCGVCSPASSTPFRTTARSSSAAGWRSSHFCSSARISMMLMVAGVSLLITSLEGWLLTPTLMGRVASMNRVAVFVGLLFWSWAWGVWGLLLAVPMMMSIKVICDHVDDLKPVGRFPRRVVARVGIGPQPLAGTPDRGRFSA